METDERQEQLTQAELHQFSEHLGTVELGLRKAQVYARRTPDGELQEIFDQMAQQHREHMDMMMDALRAMGGRPHAQAKEAHRQ